MMFKRSAQNYPSAHSASPPSADFAYGDVSGGPYGSLTSPSLARLFLFCGLAYLMAYALEAPIRYVLYLAGKDNLILARDALIIGPLVLFAVARALRLAIPAIFLIAGVMLGFHAMILIGTIGSFTGAAYGVKVLINLLFGFLLAGLLVAPSRRTFTILFAIWAVTLIGVCLDKFVVTFPWTGIRTIVGDLNVDVSKDWEIQDSMARRVAGFTRSSICVAVFMPMLTMVIMSRVKSWLPRFFLAVAAFGAVLLTTQKGAIVAFAPIVAILCLPEPMRLGLLRKAFLVFLALAVAVPLLAAGLHMDHGTGVFSTESIYLRIAYTWPQAWEWITRHQMLVFGVGLGGIGGPQRLYAPDNFNPADNVFILMWAYFGIFAILYLAGVCFLVLRPVTGSTERAVTATAILAFAFGYGIVLSMLEDQSAPLFIGTSLGVLWSETQPVRQRAAASQRWAPSFSVPRGGGVSTVPGQ